MTPSPLRELAAEIDERIRSGFVALPEDMKRWRKKLESLAGEYAVVPREPNEEMLNAARDWGYETLGKPIGSPAAIGVYRAMIEAAERPGAHAMTDTTIPRSEAIARMAKGEPCETRVGVPTLYEWAGTVWAHFDCGYDKFRIPPEPRREAREWWLNAYEPHSTALTVFDSQKEADRAALKLRSEVIHVREVLPDEVVVQRMTEAALSDWFWKWVHDGGGLEMHREPTRPDAVHNALQSLARALGLLIEEPKS